MSILRLLKDVGYSHCSQMKDADLILVNTCSIRDNAEQRILGRHCACRPTGKMDF